MPTFLTALSLLAAPETGTKTVLVTPLKAPEAMKTDAEGLQRMMGAQLAQQAGYRLVTPDQMATVDEEIVRQLERGCEDPSCVDAIGGALGATHLLSGELTQVGDRISLSVKLVEVKTVATVGSGLAVARDLGAIVDQLPKVIEQLVGKAKAPTTKLSHKARKPLFIGSAVGVIAGLSAGVAGLIQVNYYEAEADALPAGATQARKSFMSSQNQWQAVMASGFGVAMLSTVGVATALILD